MGFESPLRCTWADLLGNQMGLLKPLDETRDWDGGYLFGFADPVVGVLITCKEAEGVRSQMVGAKP